MRPTLAAVVVTLDEQANLPGLLASLDFVDQVVVVDGGSRDATLAIARRHGCRTALRPMDTFAAQRNYATQLADCDWVLSIDADERPTPALVTEIRDRIADARHVAFRVPIRSTIFGRPLRRCGTQDDCPIRLFRRGYAQWVGAVHERLRVRPRVGRLQHWLRHTTMPDLASYVGKVHRYTQLEARARVAARRAPRWYAPWLMPPREIFRRLIWKQGLLDGPAGWAFAVLSGWSEWVLARKHREYWQQRNLAAALPAKAA